MFKSGSILDLFGALILLAAVSLVVAQPEIVKTTLGGFNTALKTAKG